MFRIAHRLRLCQLDFVTHTVTALLQTHSDWVDLALDFTNAFNSIHGRDFMSVVGSHFPGMWSWVETMYGDATELYVRRPDGAEPATIRSECGTRQVCALGAQLFALGLHPLLCALARIVGTRGVVVAYCDDVHILAPPEVVAEAVPYLKPSPNGYGRVAIVAIWIVEPRGCNCRIRCARCGLLRLSLTGIKRV